MKKTIVALLLLLSTSANATVGLIATANPAGGYVNREIMVTGHHRVHIANTTDKKQLYIYTYSLCATNKDCWNQSNSVELEPNQQYVNEVGSELPVMYYHEGNFQVTAKTSVAGGEYGEVSDINNIKVYH